MKMSKRIFKTAITLFVMSAMLFSGSLWPSATGASPKRNAAAAITIKITLTFGRASKGCRGFGICKITLGGSKVSAKERIVNAELISTADDGKLQLALLDKAPEEGRTLFIDQDIPLSPETAKKLGVKNATIQRGEYAFSANRSVLNARLTK
ncbi:MAG: hypothetical protein MOB07_20530 [Acidobacteria bacterium]|nr:hypothetical protein [Acidobacteriota bacterium]